MGSIAFSEEHNVRVAIMYYLCTIMCIICIVIKKMQIIID